MANPYAKYQEQSISTATPEELTLMLYNGCIKFMNLAEVAIQDKNIQGANLNLQKSQAILQELMVTLNQDVPVSKDLYALYEYGVFKLTEANLQKSLEPLAQAKEIIADLRDAWKEAMPLARQGK